MSHISGSPHKGEISAFLVRFAGDSTYYHRITIDPKKIEEPMVFPNEVFFTIDGTRVAVKKEDWKELAPVPPLGTLRSFVNDRLVASSVVTFNV